MRKNKGGYNIDFFISQLINDKVSHLEFLSQISDLHMNDVYKKRELIDIGFKECIDLLESFDYNQFKFTKSYYNFGYLLGKLNDKYNNINYLNYGTEGQIIDFIEKSSSNYYTNLNEYLEGIKYNLTPINKKYTWEKYLKKIGFDIAIYDFIFTNKGEDYNLSNLFKIRLKEGFNEPEFENKLKTELKKILNNNNIRELSLSPNIYLELQQFFNLYKYPFKLENNINILFNNITLIIFDGVKFQKTIFMEKLLETTNYFKNRLKKDFNNLLEDISSSTKKVNLAKLKFVITPEQLDLLKRYIDIRTKIKNDYNNNLNNDLLFIRKLKNSKKLGYSKQFLLGQLNKLEKQLKEQLKRPKKIVIEEPPLKFIEEPQQLKVPLKPHQLKAQPFDIYKPQVLEFPKKQQQFEVYKPPISEFYEPPAFRKNRFIRDKRNQNPRLVRREKPPELPRREPPELPRREPPELPHREEPPELPHREEPPELPHEELPKLPYEEPRELLDIQQEIVEIAENIQSLEGEIKYDVKHDVEHGEDIEIPNSKIEEIVTELPRITSVSDVRENYGLLRSRNFSLPVRLQYLASLNMFQQTQTEIPKSDLSQLVKIQKMDIMRLILIKYDELVQRLTFILINKTSRGITFIFRTLPKINSFEEMELLLKRNDANVLRLGKINSLLDITSRNKVKLVKNFYNQQLLFPQSSAIVPSNVVDVVQSNFTQQLSIDDNILLSYLLSGNTTGLVSLLQGTSIKPFEIPTTSKRSLLPIPDIIPEEVKEDLIVSDKRKIKQAENEIMVNLENFMKLKGNLYYELILQEFLNETLFAKLQSFGITTGQAVLNLIENRKRLQEMKMYNNSSHRQLNLEDIAQRFSNLQQEKSLEGQFNQPLNPLELLKIQYMRLPQQQQQKGELLSFTKRAQLPISGYIGNTGFMGYPINFNLLSRKVVKASRKLMR